MDVSALFVTRDASFLLHRWLLAGGRGGLLVEHLQSSERVVAPGPRPAAWICAAASANSAGCWIDSSTMPTTLVRGSAAKKRM